MEPKIMMTPKRKTKQKIKTSQKMWKAPKMKTSKKMEKKNKVNLKGEDSSKVKIYLYCHSIYTIFQIIFASLMIEFKITLENIEKYV